MNITLPKWPGMIVEGDPVTPDLAAELSSEQMNNYQTSIMQAMIQSFATN